MSDKPALLVRLQSQLPHLSPAHRSLAEFIIRNPEEVAFLTTTTLGQRVGVSESTVVRLSVVLGYSGYAEMQDEVQESVRTKLLTVTRLMGSEEARQQGQPVFRQILQADIKNIEDCLSTLSDAVFDAVTEGLCSARTIFVIGLRSAHSLAYFFGFCLSQILTPARVVIVEPGRALEQMVDLGSEDMVFAMSFYRYAQATVDLVQYAKGRRAAVAIITDNYTSPLVPMAKWVLLAPNLLPSYVDSFTAPLSLINALLTAVGLRGKQATIGRLRHLETVWAEAGIYHPTERGTPRNPIGNE